MTFLMSLLIAVPAMAGYRINAENFPDAEFRNVVSEFDKDGDGLIIYDEFMEVTEIDCKDNQSLTDVTGIEIFENLERLSLWKCPLKKLDVSSFAKLIVLDCRETGISSLDVSSNPLLHQLFAYGNKFTSLDLSNCPDLEAAVKNGIADNKLNNGSACRFADDETSTYVDVDKTVTIKLADQTIKVSELAGGDGSSDETPQTDPPAQTETEKEEPSSGNTPAAGDTEQPAEDDAGSSSELPSRTWPYLPLKDGDYFLLGTEVSFTYSISVANSNGQIFSIITVEDPNGETTTLASSDTVHNGDRLLPSFTPTVEGTYTIRASTGSYIDFYLGGPGGTHTRGRFASVNDTIHIQVVKTLPASDDPSSSEEPGESTNPEQPGGSTNPTQTDDKKTDDKKTDTAKSGETSASKSVAKKAKKLPAAAKLKAADEASVTAVYNAYKALSKAEKASLPDGIASKITNAQKQIKKILKAEAADKNSVKNREAEITSRKSNSDLKKSTYAPLKVKAASTTGSAVTVSWTKVKGASGYIVYGGVSTKKGKMVRLAVTSGKKLQVKKIGDKKLEKGKSYKFFVLAYKMNKGYQKCLATSNIIHACTTGGTITNVKQVKLEETKITLKKGKTWKIKAGTVKKDSKKTLKKILSLRFESSDKTVAAVSAKGVVTAKKKGKATIFVYAQNGVCATVKVTVTAK